MAPVTPLSHVVNLSEPIPSSEDASTLELSLVSLALFTSAVLALIPSTHRQAQNNIGRPSLFITVFSIFFALLALVVTAVALAFGWARTISLDALATVVFALIPALLSMPLSNIEYAWLRFRMARFKSLSKTYGTFAYVSFLPKCNIPKRQSNQETAQVEQHVQTEHFTQAEPAAQKERMLYIRYFPRRKFMLSSVYGQFHNKCVHSAATLEQAARTQLSKNRVRGYCLEHHRNYILLQNFNKVSEVRWFRSVSSATSIIARPWLVLLNTRNGAYQALALLLDIIAFGRLVLDQREPYLKAQVTTCELVQSGLRRTEGVICRAILEEAGLKEWGSFDEDFSPPSYEFPVSSRAKKYGLLFAVITINSRIFGEKRFGFRTKLPTLEKTLDDKDSDLEVTPGISAHSVSTDSRREEEDEDEDQQVVKRVSAQSVLTTLRNFPDNGSSQDFKKLQRKKVDSWLRSWGCFPPESPVAET